MSFSRKCMYDSKRTALTGHRTQVDSFVARDRDFGRDPLIDRPGKTDALG